jgi:YD repeat-containing protein
MINQTNNRFNNFNGFFNASFFPVTFLSYAIGDETQYRNVDEEKWPQLEYDSGNHRYVLTEYSGAQTIFNNTGTMMETKDRQGRTISYLYNGDKLEKILYPEGAYMEFFYDGNGRLSSIKDSTGRETQITTDSNGQVTQVIYPDNTKREFAYNDRGLMIMDKSGNAVKTYTWHLA